MVMTGLAIPVRQQHCVNSLERHITIDRAMYGSDQAASIEPAGLKQLVGAIGKIENAMEMS